MANEVSFRIRGNNDSRRAFEQAEDDVERFTRDAQGRLRDANGRFVTEGERGGRGWSRGFSHGASGSGGGLGLLGAAMVKLATQAKDLLAPLAGVGLQVAAIGSTAVSAAPLLVPVAKALFSVGQAAVQAAPALVAFGAAGLIVKATLGEIFKEGSAARKALQPLADAFHKAGEAASEAAAKGVSPLVRSFNKLNMPTIRAGMVRIGQAVNEVTKGFLRWANSTEGIKSIKGIMDPIGRSMQQLAPHVTKVAISFTAMLGRIMGVSTAAGTKGLSQILDHLAHILDKVDKASVSDGFSKLKKTYEAVKGVIEKVVGWVKKAVDVYKQYQDKFKYLSDAIALVAMYFGGPVTAIIAGVGLIIRHWDDLKRAYTAIKNYFSSPIGKGVLSDLGDAAKKVAPAIKGAFEKIKKDVAPTLSEIGHKITHDLLPAFADFMKSAAPVAKWLIEKLGPIVGQSLKGTFEAVSGLISMMSGLFKIVSGILSGDWSKIWDGLKESFNGLGEFLFGGLRASFAPVVPFIKKMFHTMGKAFSDSADFFEGAWKTASRGAKFLINALMNAVHWINKMRGKVVKIGQKGASGVVHAVSSVIHTIGRFVGKIVRIGERGASTAAHAVKTVIGWIKRLAGKWVSIGVKGASGAIHAVSRVIGWIRNLHGKIVNVGVNVVGAAKHLLGFATGGIVHAATGGARGNMVMVGEQGPELVRLPQGSQVYPHGQSMGMAAAMGGSGGGPLYVTLQIGTTTLGEIMIDPLRKAVRTRGGNVQAVLGRG